MKNEDIIKALEQVSHPGRGDRNIVELGYVEKASVGAGGVPEIVLAFPGKRDPLAEYLVGSVRASVIRALGVEPKKGLEFDNSRIERVGKIICIASGKGGVGKSTVAVNLAVALAQAGYRVGLADADIYGPSVPVMTGTEGMSPQAMEVDGKDWILPIEKFGVKWMSVGYFAKPGQALIWRGPMACNALKQMILQVEWGPLDFLLVDLPPGTGDIHISLVQDIPVSGAVIVTTPQKVALADVEKSVAMFRNQSIGKPIYGLVENMSWFTPEELPDNKYYIFGRDGGAQMASDFGLELLGQVPIVQSVREAGDSGMPAALSDRADGRAFREIAARLVAAAV